MIWLIIVVLTQSDPQLVEIMTQRKFRDRKTCSQYVYKNYDTLNEKVNKNFGQHKSTPNLFYCASLKRDSF